MSEVEPSDAPAVEAAGAEEVVEDYTCSESGACGGFIKDYWLLFFICIVTILQSCIVSGLISANISTIEKRYGLDSTKSSFIASLYDIVVIALVGVVSYYGGKGHKPRWIGVGALLLGIGSLIFSSAQWYGDKYQPTVSDANYSLCGQASSSPTETCVTTYSPLYGMFLFGIAVIAVGSSPLYTVGTVFLDENVERDKISLYIGIFYASSALGPAIGFVLGAQLLSTWVDPSISPPVGWDTTNTEWVGAWWVGFVLTGVFALFAALPFFFFPKHLPNTQHLRVVENAEKEAAYSTGSVLTDLKALITNPVYVFNTLGSSAETFVVGGFSLFLPKVVSSTFGVTNSTAALAVGACLVPGACAGMMFSGWFVGCTKMKGKRLTQFCAAVAFIAFLFCFMFAISCDNRQVVGFNSAFPNTPLARNPPVYPAPTQPNFSATCNNACNCDTFTYDPVCGSDGLTYFSSCNAGCQQEPKSGKFESCKCIDSGAGTAMEGACASKCTGLNGFLFLLFLLMFFTFMNNVPGATITLKSLPPPLKTFGMGVQSVTYRLLGAVPGPLVLGAFIDGSCQWWQVSCGATGACRIYDNATMSSAFLGFAVICKFLSFLFFAVSSYFATDENLGDGAVGEDIEMKVNDEKENVQPRRLSLMPSSRFSIG